MNGRMDAPLSDCRKKQTAEHKALNSYAVKDAEPFACLIEIPRQNITFLHSFGEVSRKARHMKIIGWEYDQATLKQYDLFM